MINLQTTFGGGKTHSMLAVWHLFSSVPSAELPQEIQEILHAAGLSDGRVRFGVSPSWATRSLPDRRECATV